MKKIFLSIIILTLSSNVLAVAPEIMERCEEQWGDNYRMVNYCAKNQTEAKNELYGKTSTKKSLNTFDIVDNVDYSTPNQREKIYVPYRLKWIATQCAEKYDDVDYFRGCVKKNLALN